ncbi:HNH endonuclease [Haloarcula tailed virus 3]|uniref:HNH endonuclease n=1 Tax=Haloarcula tailed virus 3 TaxID=2877990 RepID=A0AAE8Y0S7_9CAUD|nr:HNH endonuclease [Haloarcula tailed virus 3]UBF23374.1 HNH endonuclease [Haloarcula tailed virus 3]
MESKPYKDKQWLEKRWFDDNTRVYEIANEAGVTPATIQTWRKKFNFPKKDDVWSQSHIDKIENLYHRENKSLEEVADELDCSVTRVYKAMEKHGVDTRSRSLAFAKNNYHAGFEINSDGYKTVVSNFKGVRDRFYLHRLLAVAEYGFDAVKGMHVHHENGIKWDNRPENIEIMMPEEHGRMHGKEREEDGFKNSGGKFVK